MRRMILALALLVGCAEEEFSYSELPPDGVKLLGCAPHPPAVTGESSELLLTVANYNDVPLRIEHIEVEGPFDTPMERPPIELPAGFGTNMTVVFAPRAPGDKVGELVLYLNAPPDELRCSLSGEAR